MTSSSTSVELLQRFIQFPTVSSQPILSFASEMAERGESVGGSFIDLKPPNTKQNVVVQIGPQGPETLGLSGHMDVVPVEGQDWSMDPFAGIINDGAVFGRGACDMKAFFSNSLQYLRAPSRFRRCDED